MGLSYLLSKPPICIPCSIHLYHTSTILSKMKNIHQIRQGNPKKNVHFFITKVEKFTPPCLPFVFPSTHKK